VLLLLEDRVVLHFIKPEEDIGLDCFDLEELSEALLVLTEQLHKKDL
jgi:hypothetical protein